MVPARWATPGRSSAAGRRPRGCLHPLGLFKAVIFLLMILLLPILMLPLLFARIATVGRIVVQYATTMRVTSGDRARSSYGKLDHGVRSSQPGRGSGRDLRCDLPLRHGYRMLALR